MDFVVPAISLITVGRAPGKTLVLTESARFPFLFYVKLFGSIWLFFFFLFFLALYSYSERQTEKWEMEEFTFNFKQWVLMEVQVMMLCGEISNGHFIF